MNNAALGWLIIGGIGAVIAVGIVYFLVINPNPSEDSIAGKIRGSIMSACQEVAKRILPCD